MNLYKMNIRIWIYNVKKNTLKLSKDNHITVPAPTIDLLKWGREDYYLMTDAKK